MIFTSLPLAGGHTITDQLSGDFDSLGSLISTLLPYIFTLAGLILNRLETIPQTGEQITVEDVRLTVKETSRRKIQSIIAIKVTHENPATPPRID